MKCAIEIPSELTWEIIKHHNAALRTSAHGVERLSAERGNVTNTHAYNASGTRCDAMGWAANDRERREGIDRDRSCDEWNSI